jgi:hypothetical protein
MEYTFVWFELKSDFLGKPLSSSPDEFVWEGDRLVQAGVDVGGEQVDRWELAAHIWLNLKKHLSRNHFNHLGLIYIWNLII